MKRQQRRARERDMTSTLKQYLLIMISDTHYPKLHQLVLDEVVTVRDGVIIYTETKQELGPLMIGGRFNLKALEEKLS